MNLCPHGLEAFFMDDAEVLFFIDNNKPQLLDFDGFPKDCMGPNHDVYPARSEAFLDLGNLLWRHHAGQLADFEGKPGEALAQGLRMLAAQQGRRNDDRDLPTGNRRGNR